MLSVISNHPPEAQSCIVGYLKHCWYGLMCQLSSSFTSILTVYVILSINKDFCKLTKRSKPNIQEAFDWSCSDLPSVPINCLINH